MSVNVSEMYSQVLKNINLSEQEKRTIALKRSTELKRSIKDYLKQKESIKTGFDIQ